ncbi:MAG: hypothetical protein BWY99_01680 [Synergistetes bacterium ADurb.BinA166]|nr:MAG: hypothetical protein BWY99_01680 [Synergistetes bacterium ADurb.BinA166]
MTVRAALALFAALVAPEAGAAPRITIIGDSHANGIAHAIHRIYPEVVVQNLSKGGTASWQMPQAPDDGSVVIVSAGTVDCGSREPDDRMVSGILRVFGPLASGAAREGRLVYVRPHSRIRGEYEWVNPRISRLNEMTEEAMPWTAAVRISEEPGPDGIHLTPEGYEGLALRALVASGWALIGSPHMSPDEGAGGAASRKWERLSETDASSVYGQICPDCESKAVAALTGIRILRRRRPEVLLFKVRTSR